MTVSVSVHQGEAAGTLARMLDFLPWWSALTLISGLTIAFLIVVIAICFWATDRNR